jgi:prolipoprotein diacylglyceryltransferase
MSPILFSFGPVIIFNFSIFVILAWLVFSFIFWQKLRNNGVEDEKIFDITFNLTVVSFVLSRVVYVVLHLPLFITGFLKVIAVWVVPGFSLLGAIFGIVTTCVIMVRKYKLRLSYVIDALGFALPAALIVGSIGSLLDGTIVGKISGLSWAVNYVGYGGKRHPVQIYDIISLVIIILILFVLERISNKRRWPYGLIGIWFFIFFGITQFALEFTKESNIYWGGLNLNQWIYVAVISESFGALYIKVGGKQKIIFAITSVKMFFQKRIKEIYDKFPGRNTRRNQKTS